MKPEPKFVPGERVVIIQSNTRPDFVGREIVVAAAQWKRNKANNLEWCWFYADGELIPVKNLELGEGRPAFGEHQLAKLPPNTPAVFDASIWQPRKVEA